MTEFPKAKKVKKSRFSPVWLTPILALAITVWLIFNGFINNGDEIRVQFDSGAGIIVGKTPLQYRGINIGKVTGFEVAESLDKVNVIIKLDKQASGIAREGMLFWVVKPRLSIDRITGLETIISGSYIEVRPPTYDIKLLKKLKEIDFFVGLHEPPDFYADNDSAYAQLIAKDVFGLTKGMPVYHRSEEAGKIINVEYDEKEKNYRVSLAVADRYKKHINSSTRFWSLNGVDFKMDAAGISMSTMPFTALLQGGVAFESDFESEQSEPLEKYELYADYESTKLGSRSAVLYMPETYGVRKDRTPVMYKGLKIGQVGNVNFSADMKQVKASVRLVKGYERFFRSGSRFVLKRPEVSVKGLSNIDSLITGVYLELIPGAGEVSYEFSLYEKTVSVIPEGAEIIKIVSDDKKGVSINSGLYFKGVRTGHITDYKLEDGKVVFDAAVYREYKHLLIRGLYFWMPDLLNVNQEADGINISTANVTQMLDSGISMGYFSSTPDKKVMKNYVLHDSINAAKEVFIVASGIKKLYLRAEDASGFKSGSPVLYNGIKVGEIGNSYLQSDGSIRVTAMIYGKYSYLLKGNTYFWKQDQMSVRFEGQNVHAELAPLESMLRRGVVFGNDAPEGFRDTRVLFENSQAAEKAVMMADTGRVIHLKSLGTDFPPSGAGVYYRGVKTGEVADSGYDAESETSFAVVAIYKKFKKTVTESTRFWKNGKVKIKAAGDGLDIITEPVSGYLTGSLSYDSFSKHEGGDILYADRNAASEPDYTSAEILLSESYGLRPGAPVMMQGVSAGFVKDLERRKDGIYAKVLIFAKYADSLREGAVFWIEDVQLSMDGLENAKSAVFGPEIRMLPGTGDRQTRFAAAKEKISPYHGQEGLRLVLHSDSRNSLEVGSPVYYRQVQAGGVEWVKLSDDGQRVETGIFIKEKYQHLVRAGSVFSPVSGIDAGFGFFSGFKLKAESVKSIIKGGVSFITPDLESAVAEEGSVFTMSQD